MLQEKSILLVCCGIALGLVIAVIAIFAAPGLIETHSLASQPVVTGTAPGISASSDLPRFSSEKEARVFLQSHIEPDSGVPVEVTPVPGQLNSQAFSARNGTRSWHFDVDTSNYKPDEYLVKVSAVEQDATATALFNVIERPSGTPSTPQSANPGTSAPANSSRPSISISPVSDHYVGDRFTITGTTNLAATDDILVEITSSSFKPTEKSQSGEFSGTSGTIQATDSAKPAESQTGATQGNDRKYSTTNVQVQGVDEADIIKTDGTNIYLVTGQSLEILRAYPAENASILSSQKFHGTPRSLYINGDRLILICGEEEPEQYWNCPDNHCRDFALSHQKTLIFVYSITDPAYPDLIREITIDGQYADSRMIGEYLYFVASTPVDSASGEIEFPRIDDSSSGTSVLPVYYFDRKDRAFSLTTVGGFNVAAADPVKARAFLIGAAGTVYVSPNRLYVAIPTSTDSWAAITGTTDIYAFTIANGRITYSAQGTVNGTLINQYSMDEYSGNLRVATTVVDWGGRWTSSWSAVTVLNDRMNQIGLVDRVAPSERIYAARFMGDRLYLVTFRETDPFFVVNLTDPGHPVVAGELILPGFSSYLHPYNDTFIIGVGKQSTGGPLKIALFDVADITSPRVVDQKILGGYGSDSEALRDPKAFLFDKEKNLLVLPVHIVGNTGITVWGGADVFGVDPNSGFTEKGSVIHYRDDGTRRYPDVKRSLYIDTTLYTMSADKIVMSNITGPVQLIGDVNLT
ncbi:MAG: beta-propeller domain-containing protein [Methanoregulaceae archaeon]